jgi:hypothetical protein
MRYSIVILILLGHLFFHFGCKEDVVKVPTITSFKPLKGRIDTLITIYGINFDRRADFNKVSVNGFPCPIISFSYDAIDSIVIKAVPGVTSGKISVTVGALAALSFDDFEVKPHTVASVLPAEGKVGDEVIITGSNYPDAIDSVKVLFYDSIPADIIGYTIADTVTTIRTIVPTNAKTGKIRVRIVGENAQSENDFTVLPD